MRDLAYNNQVGHDDGPTKRKKATTNAYTVGSQLTQGDELVAANNFFLLSTAISDESLHGLVYHATDEMNQIFESPQCALWVARHSLTRLHL